MLTPRNAAACRGGKCGALNCFEVEAWGVIKILSSMGPDCHPRTYPAHPGVDDTVSYALNFNRLQAEYSILTGLLDFYVGQYYIFASQLPFNL